MKNPINPWLVALGAAALVALTVFFSIHTSAPAGAKPVTPPAAGSNENGDAVPLALALLPAPGPVDAGRDPGTGGPDAAAANPDNLTEHATVRDVALAKGGDAFFREMAAVLQQYPPPTATELPVLSLRKAVAAATSATLDLPIHAGRASLGWINQAVRDEHRLPAPNAVRLEEILNSVTLRPTGSAAISQGVSIATECHPCPWQPSASLLLISNRGASDATHEVTASFHADPAAVALYRLLGFASVIGLPPGPLASCLPAKAITTLAIEIQPAGMASTLGSLEWTLDGKPAAAIPITVQLDAEPSDDARFAALICAYAQWLVQDQPALIDTELLAALARETASATLPDDHADLLRLIGQSLELENK